MAQPVLAPVGATPAHRTTARTSAPRPGDARPGEALAATADGVTRRRVHVEVADRAPRAGTVEFLLDAEALDATTLALAAARADVVRIVHSAALPTAASVRALVGVLEDEVAAVGRDRDAVRVVLEVETVVAADATDADRRRTHVAYAEAFAGLTWSPSSTWIVAPADQVVARAQALAARTGVDAVALAPVGGASVALLATTA